MTRAFVPGYLALSFCLVVGACGDETKKQNREVLAIGVLLPISDPTVGAQPEAWEQAMLTAQAEINVGGGVLGKELAIGVVDTGATPDSNAAAAAALRAGATSPVLVYGGLSSNFAATWGALAGMDTLVMATVASGSAVSAADTTDFAFVIPAPSSFDGDAAAQMLHQAGVQTVAIFEDGGNMLARATKLKTVFEGLSVGTNKVTTIQQLGTEAGTGADAACPTAADCLTALVASNPQAIYIFSTVPHASGLLAEWSLKGGFAGQWWGFGGFIDDAFLAALPEAANGMRIVLAGNPAELESLVTKTTTAFGTLPATRSRLGESYDAVYALALAMAAAGSAQNAATVRDALRLVCSPPGAVVRPGEFATAVALLASGQDIDYEGVSGPMNFDAKGEALAPYSTIRVDISAGARRFTPVPGLAFTPPGL